MSADDAQLPQGMGRYEEVVRAALVLREVRRRIAQGEGSEEAPRAVEERLEEAARRLVSFESPPPPDAEWLEKHEERDQAWARQQMEKHRRGEKI